MSHLDLARVLSSAVVSCRVMAFPLSSQGLLSVFGPSHLDLNLWLLSPEERSELSESRAQTASLHSLLFLPSLSCWSFDFCCS